jgi:hypothetical protein
LITIRIKLPQDEPLDKIELERDEATKDRDAHYLASQTLRAQLREVTADRDNAEIWADRLACAIGSEEEIGVHSDGNNPWAKALELLQQRLRTADDVLACVEATLAVNQTLKERVQRLEGELQIRAEQLGVACLKHDLTHALACGKCLEEARQLAGAE